MEIAAIDVFCGAGGLTLGLMEAGVRVCLGLDADPACGFAYESNTDAHFMLSDVKKTDPGILASSLPDGSLRLLAGCAPCQPFSSYSSRYRKDTEDDRWSLLRDFLRLVEAVKPELVTMENVIGLSKHSVFDSFIMTLRRLGYFVSETEVDCVRLGIPQSRRRLVLVASRLGHIDLDLPQMTTRTVRDAIGHLAPVIAGEANLDDPLHVASRLAPQNLDRIMASKPGGTWRDWPEHLVASCHKRTTGVTYPGVYGRMRWEAPAPTITTQFYGFGNGRFGHPEQDRALTLREGALLQTFPASSTFSGPDGKVHFKTIGRLIGNAVPPVLGRAIGQIFMEHAQEKA